MESDTSAVESDASSKKVSNKTLSSYEPTGNRRQIIFYRPEQTGDLVHVAAAVILNNRTDILIVYYAPKDHPELARENVSKQVQQLRDYLERAVAKEEPNPGARVREIGLDGFDNACVFGGVLTKSEKVDPTKWWDNPTSGTAVKTAGKLAEMTTWSYLPNNPGANITVEQSMKEILGWTPPMGRANKDAIYQTGNVTYATGLIAETFKVSRTKKTLPALYTKLVGGLAASELRSEDFFHAGSPFPELPKADGKPVLLLWSRYTGTNSDVGYNPAGDSDVKGQEQLIAIAKHHFHVVTLGHGPSSTNEEQQASTDAVSSECDLGEFYLHGPMAGKGRREQTSFMRALMEKYPGNLLQMGQKTGGMDFGALIGIPTLYLESSIFDDQRKRMRTWSEAMDYYVGTEVGSPTFVGKALDRLFAALTTLRTEIKLGKHSPEDAEHWLELVSKVQGLGEREKRLLAKHLYWVIKERAPTASEIEKGLDKLSHAEVPLQLPSREQAYELRGYADVDLDKIRTKLQELTGKYLNPKNRAVVLGSDGNYKERVA